MTSELRKKVEDLKVLRDAPLADLRETRERLRDYEELRPELRDFAQMMERTLREHDSDRDDSWKECTIDWLFRRLQHEVVTNCASRVLAYFPGDCAMGMNLPFESYYFGCWDDSGHDFWHPKRHSVNRIRRETLPWTKGWEIDGGLCPTGGQVQGLAKLHHDQGWTALAFWDRSVDSRPGSNSVFVIHGTHDFAAMVELAREVFPTIWKRFKFEVVEHT